METAYDIEIRGLEIDALSKLRAGQYENAEVLFAKQYKLLLKMQEEIRSRVHKGGPLHNRGIAELFQGKAQQSIKHLLQAYIEDLISSSARFEADGAPASTVLRSLCGATWDDLAPLEERVYSAKEKEIPLKPEPIYDSVPEVGRSIQRNYEEHLGTTWKFEIEGQRWLQNREFEKAAQVYLSLYEMLRQYQRSRGVRVHKGHPLHNAGVSIVNSDPKKALEYFLLAYIEDVLSERLQGQARSTPAFKALTLGYRLSDKTIQNLEMWLRARKEAGTSQFTPEDELELFKSRKERIGPEEVKLVTLRPGATATVTYSFTATGAAPKAMRNIDDLPGRYSSRVFIGGSYIHENTLHEIEKYVAECKLTGIVAIDYESPIEGEKKLLNIHDLDILLIHMCRYAIFELSSPGAQYGEVEWAIRFLNKATYGVKSTRSPRVSPHIEDLFRDAKHEIFSYSRNEDLRAHIWSVFGRRNP